MAVLLKACRSRFALVVGLTLGVLASAAVLGCSRKGPVFKEDHGPMMRIRAVDIGKKVQIIGLLGYPLQEVITVRGQWTRPDGVAKDYSLRFRVTEVNGKQLEQPVDFHRHLVSFRSVPLNEEKEPPEPGAGEVWELRAIETGRFHGLPSSLSGVIVTQPFSGFVTDLVYVSCKRVTANEIQE